MDHCDCGNGFDGTPAEYEGKTLVGASATRKTFLIRAINKWIETVKIPIVIVVSLASVSKRSANNAVTHALQLLTRVLRECTVQSELDMKAG